MVEEGAVETEWLVFPECIQLVGGRGEMEEGERCVLGRCGVVVGIGGNQCVDVRVFASI